MTTRTNVATAADLIDVEINQKAVLNIAREMGITLRRTSGSGVVTESKDFSTCILDESGNQVAFSGYVTFHVATAAPAVQAALRNMPLEEMNPGDAFICNDPHTSGAIHQGDIGFVGPYYYRGEHVGWGYVNEHVMDVGGAAVSGFAPGARDVFAEGLRFPGVRIVQGGVIDRQWEEFVANNVRASTAVLNDMRSMIAALNAGQRRLADLIDRIGIDRYREWNRASQDLSEGAVRRVIEDLPDGTYESADWVEYDGRGVEELYNVHCRLIVEGSEFTLQFRGDPQAEAFVNGARPAVTGQAWTTMIAQLFYDVPINAGIWRAVHFDLGPTGTIVNSQAPAPVTMAHMETGMRINKLVIDVTSQACALSDNPVLRSRVAGQPSQDLATYTAAGVDRRTGRSIVSFPGAMGFGCGGGAQSVVDGLETYGAQCNVGQSCPDVETLETAQPGMLLWMRVSPDSGGPGMFRGGTSLEAAFAVLHSDRLSGGAFNSCSFVPARGAVGGYPAATAEWRIARATNVVELLEAGVSPTQERLKGTYDDIRAKDGNLVLNHGDVFISVHGGGGGFGDPLNRDPEVVQADVRDGYMTPRHASEAYGVALDDELAVDIAQTRTNRQALRKARIGRTPARAAEHSGRALERTAEHWACASCGANLALADQNWRDGALVAESEAHGRLGALGLRMRKRASGVAVVVREYSCPQCASSLSVDVTLSGQPVLPAPRIGVIDRWPSSGR